MKVFEDFQHPIYDPFAVVLDTKALNKLHETITRLLWTGSTGAYITGFARTGKTTALQVIEKSLFFRDGSEVPVHRVTIPLRDKPTICSVLRNMCSRANLKFKSHDSSDQLVSTFLEFLLDKTVTFNAKRIVLIVDEMQRLLPKQLHAFAEIYDVMMEAKVALMTIFVGNLDESKALLEALNPKSYNQITGRFFTQKETFEGLLSRHDVAHCLKQYDLSHYPLPDGPTYTGYFLPDEFENGWRLESLSGKLWKAFHVYQEELGLPSWGMQYFISTVNTLLIDYLPNLDLNEIDDNVFDECVRLSGINYNLVTS